MEVFLLFIIGSSNNVDIDNFQDTKSKLGASRRNQNPNFYDNMDNSKMYPKLTNPNYSNSTGAVADFSKSMKFDKDMSPTKQNLINQIMSDKKKEDGKNSSKTNLYSMTQKGVILSSTPYQNKSNINDIIANSNISTNNSSHFNFKKDSKEVKLEAGLYNLDYSSQEKTKDNSGSRGSPTSGDMSPNENKNDIDFDNCDIFLKKTSNNNRQRSAYKFLEESFNTGTGSNNNQGNQGNSNNLGQKQGSNINLNANKNYVSNEYTNNSNSQPKSDNKPGDLFPSRRNKTKLTKPLDNDFDF